MTRHQLLGVFGQCEMEIAATFIMVEYADRPFATIDGSRVPEPFGFAELKRHGWINRNDVASAEFWRKIHGSADWKRMREQ